VDLHLSGLLAKSSKLPFKFSGFFPIPMIVG